MRAVLTVVVLSLSTMASALAVPMTLQHQGRVVDASGEPINGTHTLGFGLYDAPADGQQRFYESQLISLQDGYYSVTLGAQSGNALDAADLAGSVWVQVDVDSVGMARTPLTSAPYAISAAVADTLVDGAVVSLGDGSTVDGLPLASTLDVQAAVAGSCVTPTYSETCADWSAMGWESIEACRTDGRWHRYATTTGTFDDHSLFVDFHNASKAGADVKMRMGLEWYELTVRSVDNPNVAVWMFIRELGRHTSFVMNANGQVTDLRLGTTANAGYHSSFYDGSLGNWHYFSHNYPGGTNATDESEYGGISFWARY